MLNKEKDAMAADNLLTLQYYIQDDVASLKLSGHFVAATRVDPERILRDWFESGIKYVHVCCCGLTHIDSAGMSILLGAVHRYRRESAEVVLSELSPKLIQLFAMDKYFRVFAESADAMEYLTEQARQAAKMQKLVDAKKRAAVRARKAATKKAAASKVVSKTVKKKASAKTAVKKPEKKPAKKTAAKPAPKPAPKSAKKVAGKAVRKVAAGKKTGKKTAAPKPAARKSPPGKKGAAKKAVAVKPAARKTAASAKNSTTGKKAVKKTKKSR